MLKTDNRRTLLEGLEWRFIGAICSGMGSYDVVGYFICPRIGTAYSRGKNSNPITQPSHNESFIECNPKFNLGV